MACQASKDPIIVLFTIVLGTVVLWSQGPAVAADIADISGMVALHGNTAAQQRYLIVNDKKDRDRPQDQGPRVGIITVDDDRGLNYEDLDVPVEAWGNRPANDLEAACRVPGREDAYLLLESSYYKDRYGRLFLVTLRQNTAESYDLHVLHTYQLPRAEEHVNLEGVVCFSWRGGLHVLLGDRADYARNRKETAKTPRGTLFYAPLPRESGELQWMRLADLVSPAFAGHMDQGYRHCCDLFLQELPETPGRHRLWVTASYDPDNKTGPFRSEIYVAGIVNLRSPSPGTLFEPLPEAHSVWRSDTVKIEALAASLSTGSGLCMGTDDEGLGGVWRNLGTPRAALGQ